jgi:hypothetical protein
VPRRCKCKRDTYLYELKDKGRVVYRGITTDVERRVREHKRAGKRFTTVWDSGIPYCRRNALKHEVAGIQTYKRTHGRIPRHNKKL